jgi:hypothetical protein
MMNIRRMIVIELGFRFLDFDEDVSRCKDLTRREEEFCPGRSLRSEVT